MGKLSLSQKMTAIFVLLSAGILAVSVIGLVNIKEIGKVVTLITDVQFKNVVETMNLKDSFHSQMIYERNYVLFYFNPEKRANNAAQIAKLDESIQALIKHHMNIMDPRERKSLDEFSKAYNLWLENDKKVQAVMATEKGTEEALRLISTVGRDSRLAGDKALDEIVSFNHEQLEFEKKSTIQAIQSALEIMVTTSLIVIFLGGVLAFTTLRNLSKAINNILSLLSNNAAKVQDTASQIASSSDSLSQSSTEQASSLEETVATIEELTAMVKVNADNATQATLLSENTLRSAQQGENKIQALLETMKVIDLDSKKIQEITKVVDDIAFQTNLLALNAAVEAARAGEQGKGFAVVAEAVRTLAARSSEAAKDINSLISSSVQRIQSGYSEAGQSVASLSEIVGSVKKVADLNSEISTATTEQSNGIIQIGKAMNQLDAVTQGNAAASEQAAASSQELAGEAIHLNGVVENLRVVIKGA
ncbi:methyl-accepting chemotaxis protein [Bdellovibrio sp. SKB1291214]|uniref:methyl-accepting chemotaxis protein n=1 Tax=Bdellovibrio sp. SKB1291214 TaxID=1732569 RepID=UPI000B51648D|nr:methyl-accepting chemotaxis protein [Bdellovibrio sp. SKB1291214]UYL07691.1 methyl-accepting chemotaxis protein [Bdellovibrio sp. SKB1291214]